MQKRMSKLMAIGIAAGMITVSLPVCAATTNTAVAGTATTFDKYFVVDSEAKVPTETFSYTIEAGTAIDYSAGNTMAVFAGVGTPTIADVTFGPKDTASGTVASGDTVTLDTGESYVKKAATIDFSSVTFDEPGIYRYVVKEVDSRAQGVSYDTQKSDDAVALTRILDVYVTNNNGTLEVSSYVLHDVADNVSMNATSGSDNGTTLADKSTGYVNEFTSHDLTISKSVSGNQASHDKYFKYTIEISGASANTILPVELSGDNASADTTVASNTATLDEYEGKTNPATIEVGADGTATATFYLQHGQSIRIDGLADGTKYTVIEVPEDYTASVAVTGDNDGTADGAAATDSATGITADTEIAFTNTKNGTIPTGVLLSMAPYAVLAGLALSGVVFFMDKKKSE